MAIVVEDGSGVVGANSYVSEAEAEEFFSDRDFAAPDNFTALLYQSMDVLNQLGYTGTKAESTDVLTFPLPFPRTDILDLDGNDYEENTIPSAVKSCQLWLTYYINLGFNPGDVTTAQVKREKVEELEVEYAIGVTSATATITLSSLPHAYSFIRHLLLNGSGTGGVSNLNNRVIRA